MENKIPVAILGATGMVGQRFIELLANHPWFEITALMASERSEGKRYREAVTWVLPSILPSSIGDMIIRPCTPTPSCQVAFSGLSANVAGPIEELFAKTGFTVISNARNHRMNPSVPLLVPEVNSPHLGLLQEKSQIPGKIVTNPNCSVVGITLALKPLVDLWGVEKMHVTTLQAVSGAGYPGVSSFDILDNVIPFISGEEEKIESEPLKILGCFKDGEIRPYQMSISAQCNRVAVMDGHMACVSVKFKNKAAAAEIVAAWKGFKGEPQELELPQAPVNPIFYFSDEKHPQPKLHRYIDKGMSVSIGRLRECPILDWKFVLLSHNTLRGAAGSAILNAELMVKKKYI